MKADYSKKEILIADIIAIVVWIIVWFIFAWLVSYWTSTTLNDVFSFLK